MTGRRFITLLPVLALPMLVLGACGVPDEVAPPEASSSTTRPSVVVDVVPDNGWIQVARRVLLRSF